MVHCSLKTPTRPIWNERYCFVYLIIIFECFHKSYIESNILQVSFAKKHSPYQRRLESLNYTRERETTFGTSGPNWIFFIGININIIHIILVLGPSCFRERWDKMLLQIYFTLYIPQNLHHRVNVGPIKVDFIAVMSAPLTLGVDNIQQRSANYIDTYAGEKKADPSLVNVYRRLKMRIRIRGNAVCGL